MGFVCKNEEEAKNLSSRPSSFAEDHAEPQIDRYWRELTLNYPEGTGLISRAVAETRSLAWLL